MKRYVVLLSAGLDSSFNLWRCRAEGEIALAITYDYGQRAATQEIKYAAKQCAELGIAHKVLALNWFADFADSALINSDLALPHGDEVDIESLDRSRQTAQRVWVPNRNGIFLNIAAAYAEHLGAQAIVPGFNREEAATFPDNSVDFSQAINHSLSYSTATGVRVESFSSHLDKSEIVAEALKWQVRLDLVWACYFAGPEPCGNCESCQRFLRALSKNHAAKLQVSPGYAQYLKES